MRNKQIVALFGKRLRKLRVAHGMSLDMLARESGLTKCMLSRIENSLSIPSLQTLVRIADVFGFSISKLIDD